MNLEEEEVSHAAVNSSFPVLSDGDVERVAQTILDLFSPSTSSNPALAKHLQHELQSIQSTPEAWGLIAGLSTHNDSNVRFFSAHTAQVKISRDWDSLPSELQPSLLALLLQTLSQAISPLNPLSYQSGNGVVVRKIFGCLASLLLRIPFPYFPNPILTVLQTISSAAVSQPLPPSAPSSGYNTPTTDGHVRRKLKLWGLEWCGMCVEEIGRAGLSNMKMQALRKHIETDLPVVMATLSDAMRGEEAEAACKCAESWIGYGLGADELTALLPSLYNLLPLPAASSAIVEALSESVFKFGKGTKILTEPLIAWVIGPGQSVVDEEELLAFTKLLCALIEHSDEWLVARFGQSDVQTFLTVVLRLTASPGIGGVDENVSQMTLPIYPLIQEAVMDSDLMTDANHANWGIAKHFFRELVSITRQKVRWPETALDKEDKESFESWRRDAGEVIVGAYYILRDEMLSSLVGNLQIDSTWQDIEATLHCIRYSSEAVPLGEDKSLPILFGSILSRLSQRNEDRLRLTVVCVIRSYEEWFKFHPDHLLPVLAYLVPSLTASSAISRTAADALKALCDMCRAKLVEHIDAFSELHGKIGDLGPEEQTKVIEAITSVIEALSPADAIGPVEGIILPIIDRLSSSTTVQSMNALTACFKGLSPSEDLFDQDDSESRVVAIASARSDPRMVAVRQRIEASIASVIQIWQGDAEMADAISSLLKHAATSETLISLSPLPLLSLVCSACETSPSALWMSLASTLTLRINSPPSFFQKSNPDSVQDEERWGVVANVASRLVVIAGIALGLPGAMAEQPDVAEGWFRFSSALATRFPGILVRLQTQMVGAYMSLALLGLSAQERFTLKTAAEFFIALLSGTRFPSPLESLTDPMWKHYAPLILRSLLLSAGSEGPRSVIPNLAELLAAIVARVSGEDMSNWLNETLAEDGFPDPRATFEAKNKLKQAILRGRTTRKMSEALHQFALVARGLDGTTYGNATAI